MNIDQYIADLKTKPKIEWLGHLIDGQWQKSFSDSEVRHSENPSDGSVFMEPHISKDAVMAAVDFAYDSRHEVQQLGFERRIEELQKFCRALGDYSEAFITMLKYECGRTDWEAHEDVSASIRYLDFITKNAKLIRDSLLAPASIGKSMDEFKILPIGVTLGYLPFSTPLTTFCTYFSASMLTGCPLVCVSTTHSAGVATLLGLVATKIHLPFGLLSLTFGSFKKTKTVFKEK